MLSGMHDRDAVRAEAERNAPYPKIEPSWAGMYGFAIACVVSGVFAALAGIDFDEDGRAGFALLAMVAIGFAGPFIYFNNQKRRHFQEWLRLDSQARERDA